jgi:DNA-binding transcriptional ArsR family regulator
MVSEFQWYEDKSSLHTEVLGELNAEERTLLLKIRALGSGSALVQFLSGNANALLSADDIAYRLGKSRELIERDLRALTECGLVRRVDAAGFAFFGLTDDPHLQELLCGVRTWREQWHERLAQLERVVDGVASHDGPNR